jgi:hypothetical protein
MPKVTQRYKMHVRDIIKQTKEEVWLPKKENRVAIVDLEFDNGDIVETNEWYNSISWYYLQILSRFPQVTINKEMHLGLRSTSSRTLMEIISTISAAVFNEVEESNSPSFCEYFGGIIYALHSDMYNDCGADTGMIPEYVDMSDIFDYYAIANLPEIKEAKENGAFSVSTEFLCLELRTAGFEHSKKNYERLNKAVGFDILEFYRQNSEGSGYLRLNFERGRNIYCRSQRI